MFRTLRRLSTPARQVAGAGRSAYTTRQHSTATLKLSSGYDIPLVGFGIWKVPRESCEQTVYEAIRMGYRHIDGAYDYRNSAEAGRGVARAVRDGLARREELFVTSKLWNNFHRREHAADMARREVEAWGLDYLDLYLVHFPISLRYVPHETHPWPGWSQPLDPVPVAETWGALEGLVGSGSDSAGVLRSLGVANFSAQLLYDLLASASVPPAMLQIEHHPYLAQPQLVAMAQENGVAVTAYSSFGPLSFLELGNPRAAAVAPLLGHPVVAGVAARHGRTPAQVLLRWATQRGVVVIPKSNHPDRARQNLESTGFDLSEADMAEIAGLDVGVRFNDPGMNDPPIRIFA